MATILFPRKGNRLRAHSVFFQAHRVAASGIGVLSGMAPSRSSASAIAVASGTYRNCLSSASYSGGSISGIPVASSGMHRYDLIVFDVSDVSLKRIEGSEGTPTQATDFLENLNPQPPELNSASQILLGIIIVTSEGIPDQSYGSYATGGVASMIIELPTPHSQNTDQYLDYGGSNQVSAADAKDAVSKKHTQNTDQYLDYGGSNQVSAADAKDAVSKKHTQNTDQYLDYGGSNQVSAVDAKDAVSKKHTQGTDQYLDYGGSNQISAEQLKKFYKHELNFNLSGGGIVIPTGLAGGIQVPFDCRIKEVRLLSVDGTSGSITVSVWKGTYSSPPTSADTIGSWSISSGTKSEATGLSISLSSENILYFNVSSVTSLKLVLMVLEVEV